MKLIAISGSIGTGKTTLCTTMAKLTGWSAVREEISRNAFLGPFYDDMNRWALASQLRFMIDKTRQFEGFLRTEGEIILVDRTIEEDFYVFCSVLRSYNILRDDEFYLLEDIFSILYHAWKRPDLVIYLEDSPENCFDRILRRGYAGENKLELGYVERISNEYRKWSKEYLIAPYIILNPSEVDFRVEEGAQRAIWGIKSLLHLK